MLKAGKSLLLDRSVIIAGFKKDKQVLDVLVVQEIEDIDLL